MELPHLVGGRGVARRADLRHVGEGGDVERTAVGDARHERPSLLVDGEEQRDGHRHRGGVGYQGAELVGVEDVLAEVHDAADRALGQRRARRVAGGRDLPDAGRGPRGGRRTAGRPSARATSRPGSPPRGPRAPRRGRPAPPQPGRPARRPRTPRPRRPRPARGFRPGRLPPGRSRRAPPPRRRAARTGARTSAARKRPRRPRVPARQRCRCHPSQHPSRTRRRPGRPGPPGLVPASDNPCKSNVPVPAQTRYDASVNQNCGTASLARQAGRGGRGKGVRLMASEQARRDRLGRVMANLADAGLSQMLVVRPRLDLLAHRLLRPARRALPGTRPARRARSGAGGERPLPHARGPGRRDGRLPRHRRPPRMRRGRALRQGLRAGVRQDPRRPVPPAAHASAGRRARSGLSSKAVDDARAIKDAEEQELMRRASVDQRRRHGVARRPGARGRDRAADRRRAARGLPRHGGFGRTRSPRS